MKVVFSSSMFWEDAGSTKLGKKFGTCIVKNKKAEEIKILTIKPENKNSDAL